MTLVVYKYCFTPSRVSKNKSSHTTKTTKQSIMKVPKNSGLSSKAIEYVERFSSGCQAKTALKKVVEYRDECKTFYNATEKTRNSSNKREVDAYLADMLTRIKILAEARDYITDYISKGQNKKNDNNYKTAMKFIPTTTGDKYKYNDTEKKTDVPASAIKSFGKQPTKIPYECLKIEDYSMSHNDWLHNLDLIDVHGDCHYSKSYFTRKPSEFVTYYNNVEQTYSGEHVVKYILRFQKLAQRGGDFYLYTPEKCLEEVYKYKDEMEEQKDNADNNLDEESYEFYNERYEALERVASYFEEVGGEIDDIAHRVVKSNKKYMNDNHGCNFEIPEESYDDYDWDD
ncbi:hypothetical protein PBCVKS1B_580R [Paramecium bursaria Chlorella virus KS1B]|nr:hypothetical protein PBCVKS1B_580R [Paramecium bursaria Chlorella virus KS1B]